MKLDFDEIYNDVAPSVYRYLRRLTGSRAQAEDIAQETFLRLHSQLASGAAISHYKAWLFQVATNLARNEKRKEILSALRDGRYYTSLNVVDFQSSVEQQQVVRRALAHLTPRMRQVLLLFSEGFSYREISEISGIEAAYVGVLLHRARTAFKKRYKEEYGRNSGQEYQSSSL